MVVFHHQMTVFGFFLQKDKTSRILVFNIIVFFPVSFYIFTKKAIFAL